MTDLRWGGQERDEPNVKPRLRNTVLLAGKEMRMDWEALDNFGTILGEKAEAEKCKRKG